MKNILRTRSLKGCPINAPFRDLEGVLDQVVQCTCVLTDIYTSVHAVWNKMMCSYCIHRMRLLVTISIRLVIHQTLYEIMPNSHT
jgi:hypothetical protein